MKRFLLVLMLSTAALIPPGLAAEVDPEAAAESGALPFKLYAVRGETVEEVGVAEYRQYALKDEEQRSL